MTRERCSQPECDRNAAVRLSIPWADDRDVCVPHARALANEDGVVATPIPGRESEWP